jgi:cysteine desulfurase / selenocysteine lyase
VSAPALDVERVRKDFPILERTNRGQPLVYLDTAATAQKPRAVIEALADFYARDYAAVHRSVFEISEIATRRFEDARESARRLVGAAHAREIVFTRNATEALNLVAASWGRHHVGPGDEVLLTEMEHHANIVPWQMLCEERGARLRVAPIDDRGALDMEAFAKLLSERTRIVAVAHVSNVLGTVNPVAEIGRLAHDRGAVLVVDGAQAASRIPVDVASLGCDFYAFSAHKLYGPTGTGVLWGRAELLDAMPPYQTGGSMIESVSFEKTTFAQPPQRFEAGTPDVAGAVGLAAAIDYVQGLGLDRIAAHEAELLVRGTERLSEIPEVRIVGEAPGKIGVLSFVVDGVHPHDVGTVLDQQGVAIRAGHHCAQPLMERFGVPATARASLGLYNREDDLDRLASAVREAVRIFR